MAIFNKLMHQAKSTIRRNGAGGLLSADFNPRRICRRLWTIQKVKMNQNFERKKQRISKNIRNASIPVSTPAH